MLSTTYTHSRLIFNEALVDSVMNVEGSLEHQTLFKTARSKCFIFCLVGGGRKEISETVFRLF